MWTKGTAASLLVISTTAGSAAASPADPAAFNKYVQAANTASAEKRFEDAEKQYLSALKEAEKFPPGDTRIASTLNRLLATFYAEGKLEQAVPVMDRIVKFLERLDGPRHADVAVSLGNYQALLEKVGRDDDAHAVEQRISIIKGSEIANCVGASMNDARVQMVLHGLTDIQRVYLDNSSITDAALTNLKGMTAVQWLTLSATRVGDSGLVNARNLKTLRVLTLGETAVTDAGMANLKALTELRTLSLEGTAIGDAGLAAIGPLPNLRSLNLTKSRVTDAGMAPLKQLPELEELNLTDCPISDAGMAQLKGMTKLRSLALGGSKITDACLVNFKTMPALENLNLSNTVVSDDAVGKLQQALNKMKIYHGKH